MNHVTTQTAPSRPHTGHVFLSPEILPTGDSVTFKSAPFFNRPEAYLPHPVEVRRIAGHQASYVRPPPVVFHSMGLLVKYGQLITNAEAQCLWAIKRYLPEVPVPDVYGWCRDGKDTFIYMEFIPGVTLEQCWNSLNEEEKHCISEQLRQMVQALQRFKQNPADPFIGKCSLAWFM